MLKRQNIINLCKCSFLLGLFVISCDKIPVGASNEVPSYYKEYLQNKISKLNVVLKAAEGKVGSFVFITDTHVWYNQMNSPALIRELLKNTDCTRVVWGGDAIWAYTWDAYDTPVRAKEQIIAQWRMQYDSFRNAIIPLGKIYNVRGNHDLTIRVLDSDMSVREGLGYTFDHDTCFEEIVGDIVSDPDVHFNADDNGCYFF